MIDWDKLRDAFFDECVDKEIVTINKKPTDYRQWINLTPHNLFEWFKKKIKGDNE